MMRSLFNTSLAISLATHFCVAGILCVSFGRTFLPPQYGELLFLGRLMKPFDLDVSSRSGNILPKNIDRSLLGAAQSPVEYDLVHYAQKPSLDIAGYRQKGNYAPLPDIKKPVALQRDSVVMLYPQLPYNFLLYFKDRQQVHIELMFKVDSFGKYNAITVMRKISSGNLDVDLLSMRYIDRYLFMQQARLSSGKWQTVKIDLRPRDER